MPKLPPGTGQLNISGVRNEIIEEFKKMCEPQGHPPRRKKTWEVFEQIWNEWKKCKEKESDQEPEGEPPFSRYVDFRKLRNLPKEGDKK